MIGGGNRVKEGKGEEAPSTSTCSLGGGPVVFLAAGKQRKSSKKGKEKKRKVSQGYINAASSSWEHASCSSHLTGIRREGKGCS